MAKITFIILAHENADHVADLANLLTAGKEAPIISALDRMLAMRATAALEDLIRCLSALSRP